MISERMRPVLLEMVAHRVNMSGTLMVATLRDAGGGIGEHDLRRLSLIDPDTPIARSPSRADGHHRIIALTEGSIVICAARRTLRLVAGRMAILPAGRAYGITQAGGCRGADVLLSPTPRWAAIARRHVVVTSVPDVRSFIAPIAQIEAEARDRLPGRQRIIDACCAILTVRLERALDPSGHCREPVGDMPRRLHALWAAVGDQLGRRWTVARPAAVVGVSVPHFHRLMQRHERATPHEVLRRLRLSRARYLLLNTDLTLAEIAHRTGFATSFALSKAFKQVYGQSPRAIRRGDAGT